ncbi:uncharacterized protein Z518_05764 [Rhinocladiella mackenziei CBS 650.93]|uniref:Major facilitator superfamily (MFS) profile domain-containing protein n=1 Tax=Rhinocladiella mackenziei CBS 650.93 TaxID=1442369 RepID=A0A0D2H395_9EURO|nr:uncharacterized protein Z518_05764 [Rhinocladiella mackenziei CBS 650.93]KIX04893.1 hypothetical protein Z518_05764 [Rhinocladiella mackenziei CBS 650.93]
MANAAFSLSTTNPTISFDGQGGQLRRENNLESPKGNNPVYEESNVFEDIKERQQTHEGNEQHIVCEKCQRHIMDHDRVRDQEANHHTHYHHQGSKIVTWDGPNDPSRPMNMSQPRKWLIALTTGGATFSVSFASSVFSTTVFVAAEEYHVSSEVMLLGVSLFVLGFAFGPLIFGPLSEVYGRMRPLMTGMVFGCAFTRALFAAGFPLFSTYMYENLGVDWATSVLGFVCLALIPFPLILFRYGKRIRGWRRFAYD